LQRIELQQFFFGNHPRLNPTESRETPTRHSRGTISFASPRPTCHEAPITNSMRSKRRVVEIGQSKQVTEFVRKNTDAPVFRFGAIGKRLDSLIYERLRKRPLMRPDHVFSLRGIWFRLRTPASIDKEDRIYKPVVVLVKARPVVVQ